MAKLNMANMNALLKKGYLLAGVMIAANMFVVNEMRASETGDLSGQGGAIATEKQFQGGNISQQKEIETKEDKEVDPKKQSPLDKLLSLENYINLIGGVVFSGANNYFKWWDYNAGGYLNLRIGCLGWRTKKFFDIVQLDFNLNLGRGIFWLIPHIIKFRRSLTKAEKIELKDKEESQEGTENISGSNASLWVSFLFKDILRGFVSAPLTFHISKFNFSISISLDSIIWEIVICKLLGNDKNKIEGGAELDSSNQKLNNENNENPGTTV